MVRRALSLSRLEERRAWLRAEAKGIIPQEVITLQLAPKNQPKGIVYLLRCGRYCKIGKSTDPERRYGELRIQLPEEQELVHEIDTNDVDYCERHWHCRFAAYRSNGEWFLLSPPDVDEFCRCKRMVVGPANS